MQSYSCHHHQPLHLASLNALTTIKPTSFSVPLCHIRERKLQKCDQLMALALHSTVENLRENFLVGRSEVGDKVLLPASNRP